MMGGRWSDVVVQIIEFARNLEAHSWEFVLANVRHAPPSHQKVAILVEGCANMEDLVGARGGEASITFGFFIFTAVTRMWI